MFNICSEKLTYMGSSTCLFNKKTLNRPIAGYILTDTADLSSAVMNNVHLATVFFFGNIFRRDIEDQFWVTASIFYIQCDLKFS